MREQEKAYTASTRQQRISQLEMWSEATAGIGELFGELYASGGKHMSAFFHLQKAAAIAQVGMDTATAIMRAYALSPNTSFGAVMAPILTALGAAQIAKITAQMISGPGFATGGQVHGRKGDDQINARLTDKEFVHPVKAVSYYGTGVMEAMRRRAIPREALMGYGRFTPRRSSHAFAEGGMATATGTGDGGNVQIVNLLDPSLMTQFMSGRDGQRTILNVIAENSRQVRESVFS